MIATNSLTARISTVPTSADVCKDTEEMDTLSASLSVSASCSEILTSSASTTTGSTTRASASTSWLRTDVRTPQKEHSESQLNTGRAGTSAQVTTPGSRRSTSTCTTLATPSPSTRTTRSPSTEYNSAR